MYVLFVQLPDAMYNTVEENVSIHRSVERKQIKRSTVRKRL